MGGRVKLFNSARFFKPIEFERVRIGLYGNPPENRSKTPKLNGSTGQCAMNGY